MFGRKPKVVLGEKKEELIGFRNPTTMIMM